jgi:hypothetical protein
LYVATQLALEQAVAFGAASSARKATGLPRSSSTPGVFAVERERFVALKTETGAVATELTPAKGSSFFSARDAVSNANNPNRAVVPAYVLEVIE